MSPDDDPRNEPCEHKDGWVKGCAWCEYQEAEAMAMLEVQQEFEVDEMRLEQ